MLILNPVSSFESIIKFTEIILAFNEIRISHHRQSQLCL